MAPPHRRDLPHRLFGTPRRRSRHGACTAVTAGQQCPGRSVRTADRQTSSRRPGTGRSPDKRGPDESERSGDSPSERPRATETAKRRSRGDSGGSVREGGWRRRLPARRSSDRTGKTETHSVLCNQSRSPGRCSGCDRNGGRAIQCESEPPSLSTYPIDDNKG
jgi:hypothetical protein